MRESTAACDAFVCLVNSVVDYLLHFISYAYMSNATVFLLSTQTNLSALARARALACMHACVQVLPIGFDLHALSK